MKLRILLGIALLLMFAGDTRSQTHTFCALDTPCTWTATQTFGNVVINGTFTANGTFNGSVTGANFGSQSGNLFWASPNGSSGVPVFRGIAVGDVPTLNQNTTGNAATATALAALPVQCGTNNFATGIAANGNAACLQPSFANLSGTIALGQIPSLPNTSLTNSSITINAPSFQTGWGTVSLGGSLSPSWSSETANTFLAAPNGASGAPTFRAIIGADLPLLSFQINGGTSSGIFSTSGCSPIAYGGACSLNTAGTSGGVPYFSAAGVISSSGVLGQNGVLVGGGVSGAPQSATPDTTTTHAFFATAGVPQFRAIAGADIPAVNLAATGNGGITGNLPVGNIAPGTNGQCINTSASATVWGSCAGTAGVQTLSVNTTAVTVNTSTTANQSLMSFTFSAGSLNALGKSFRITAEGIWSFVNTSETVQFSANLGATGAFAFPFTPVGTAGGPWRLIFECSVSTAGSSGQLYCDATAPVDTGTTAHTTNITFLDTSSDGFMGLIGANLVNSLTFQLQISFGTASASNSATQGRMVVEQLN